MTNGNIEITHPTILQAIRRRYFGAVIEVTNGIPSPAIRQRKKKQLKTIRRYLEMALGDSARVVGGLAVIKSEVDEIKELDFFMKIEDYNMTLLEYAVDDVRRGNMIGNTDKQFLGRLTDIAEHNRYLTLRSLLNPTESTLRRLSKTTRSTYVADVARIKGAVLEVYVRMLFSQAIEGDYEVASRAQLRDRSLTAPERTQTEADLIFAISEPTFRLALEKIVKMYDDGKQKVTVTYPNGF